MENLETADFEIVKFMTEKENEITQKWDNMELLDGLNDEQKKKISKAFELAYIMFNSDLSERFGLATKQLAFPIMRRIIEGSKEEMSTNQLIGKTLMTIEKLNTELKLQNLPWTIKRLNDIIKTNEDVAGSFVVTFCENNKI